MKALVCEMCGSQDLVKQDGMYVCQNCGTKYAPEEAKKLMVEVSGSVKVDNTEKLKNYYQLAHRAKENNNADDALKYYDLIRQEDPDSWEANFYPVYYRTMQCKIAEIALAAAQVSNCEKTVFTLIKEKVEDKEEQEKAMTEVVMKLITVSAMLFGAAKNHYDGIDAQVKNRFVQQYANNGSAARDILYNAGNHIVSIFGDEYGMKATACWREGVRQHNILNGVFKDKKLNADIINSYNEKIKKYDPSYNAPATNMQQDGGCYVATAVYGSYDCPEVWTLRRYRDYTLAETWLGRLFISLYYAVSPTLVSWFGKTQWFINMWKPKLDKMVKRLNEEGVADTPYQDRQW